MRQLFFIFFSISILSFYTCDDGDVITTDLEFEETFEACGSDGLVFYKTKDDPSESLSIIIKELDSIGDLLVVGDDNTYEVEYELSSTNVLNYRTYSNSSLPTSGLFCSDVALSSVTITKDIESTTGTVYFKTVLTEDDDDDIDAETEGYTNDTDGDGILDYLDQDDDGDNVLTKNENPDPDGDGDLSDAQDTDDDGIPDYLDDDDDGDGILTRDEENDSVDQNPSNDYSLDGIADYLNPAVATQVPATAYRQHLIYQTYVVTLTVTNFSLQVIALDTYDFGILDDDALSTYRTITPDFD